MSFVPAIDIHAPITGVGWGWRRDHKRFELLGPGRQNAVIYKGLQLVPSHDLHLVDQLEEGHANSVSSSSPHGLPEPYGRLPNQFHFRSDDRCVRVITLRQSGSRIRSRVTDDTRAGLGT
jgi:hypothetical protein